MEASSVKHSILEGIAKHGRHVEPLFVLLTTDFQTEYRLGGKRGTLLIREWCNEQNLQHSEVIIHVKAQPQIGILFEPVTQNKPIH